MLYDTFQHYEGLSPVDGMPINFVTKNFTLPSFKVKNTSDIAMMLVWITNCGIESTGRIRILNKLAAHGVTYASYGGCQHTHSANKAFSTWPSEWQPDTKGAGAVKIAVSSRHLFMYAAEKLGIPVVHYQEGLSWTCGRFSAGIRWRFGPPSTYGPAKLHHIC